MNFHTEMQPCAHALLMIGGTTMVEAAAMKGTSVAAITTDTHRKPTINQSCFCFWPNCEDLHLEGSAPKVAK
jgi:hypothetical protein